jgi:hypothetical protein
MLIKIIADYEWLGAVDTLQKVEVAIWETEKCRKEYKGISGFPHEGFICAGKKGKDSCTVRFTLPDFTFNINSWK